MIRTTTALLGAGLLAIGLGAPPAANAEDNALAFVVGAAAGQALDHDPEHLRHPHRSKVVHVRGSRGRDYHRDWRGHHRGRYQGRGHEYGHAGARRWAHYRNDYYRNDYYRKDHYRKDYRGHRRDWRHHRYERGHARHHRRDDRHDGRWDRKGGRRGH